MLLVAELVAKDWLVVVELGLGQFLAALLRRLVLGSLQHASNCVDRSEAKKAGSYCVDACNHL